jgi:excisionase family DNA binding protein
MAFDPFPEYLTIEQAAAYRGVSVATIRRVLRQYGLTEFARASMNKQVLIKRTDLDEMSLDVPVRAPKAKGARRSA